MEKNHIRNHQIWAEMTWREFHTGNPAWTAKKREWADLTKAIKILGADFRAVWETFLRNDTRFNSGHPPSKFLYGLDGFIQDTKRVKEGLPLDPQERELVRMNRAMRAQWEK